MFYEHNQTDPHLQGEGATKSAPFRVEPDGTIDVADLMERLEFIGPKVGRLRGDGVIAVDPNDSIAVAKAKAAIKDRHKSWAKSKVDSGAASDGTHVLTVLRICQIEAYLHLRYGNALPDDDAGREDLVILLNHVAHNRTDPAGKMMGFIRYWAPLMPPAEAGTLITKIMEKPRKYSPATLGKLLRLTEAERALINATTIRAFDATDESMKAKAKQKDREYQKAKRAEKSSGRPRGRPKADVPAWVAAGFKSKRTYQRHKVNGTLATSQCGTKNESEALDKTSYAPDGLKVPRADVIDAMATLWGIDAKSWKNRTT